MKCRYCNHTAVCVESRTLKLVFNKSHKYTWLCRNCSASVSCSNYSKKPMGTLADLPTRTARSNTHKIIDPIWQTVINQYGFARKAVYHLISEHMGKVIHIAECEIDDCNKIIEFAKTLTKEQVITKAQYICNKSFEIQDTIGDLNKQYGLR